MSSQKTRPLLLGHRGASKDAPENTVTAFEMALTHGADGFEFDVRRTSDGQLAICHDPALHGFVVAETPFKKLLNYSHCAIPTLADVLERYRHRAYLDIELKVAGMEAEVLALLKQFPPTKGAMITSFLPEVITALAKLGSVYPVGYICKRPEELRRWRELPVTYAVLHYNVVPDALIQEIAAVGKKLVVWTVNDEMEMRRFAGLGVCGIIADDTRLMTRVLGGMSVSAGAAP
jgi:glycerophosphoryl diester phosphodiesterase